MSQEEYLAQLNRELSFLKEESRRAAVAFYAEMLDDRMEDGMDEASAVNAMENPADIAQRLRTENGEEAASPLHLAMRDEMLEFSALADSALRGVERATMGKPEIAPTADEMVRRAKAGTRMEHMEDAPEEVRRPEGPQAEEPKVEEPKADQPKQNDFSSLVDGLLKGVQGVLENVTGLVEDGEKTAQDAAESVRDAGREAKAVIKNIRDEEEEAYEGAANVGEYEQKVFTCRAEDVRGVRLEVAEMPLVIKPCKGEEIRLVYYRSDREPYRAGIENGVLILENEAQGRKNRGFNFTFFANGLRVIWNQATPTVELLMPADALADLTAHTGNSSIRVEGMKALCDVDLKTSNGRISVQETVCKTLEAKTSNSRIVLEKVEAKRDFHAKTSNSRIEASKVRSGSELRLSTSNGRVQLFGAQAPVIAATTSNGSIRVGELTTHSILLRSSNGSIQGTVPGKKSDWAIESGQSNGKNSLPRQQAGQYPLSVHTSNGNIQIEFEE